MYSQTKADDGQVPHRARLEVWEKMLGVDFLRDCKEWRAGGCASSGVLESKHGLGRSGSYLFCPFLSCCLFCHRRKGCFVNISELLFGGSILS